ncbi:MAG: hypothetical protein AAF682_01745 [Planctomycetota bacterium]
MVPPEPPTHEDAAFEERLRNEATRERRAAPDGLLERVLSGIDAEAPRPPAAPTRPLRSERERPLVVLTAAAAAALLTAIWVFDPFDFIARGKVGKGSPLAIGAFAEEASASVPQKPISSAVEQPLLRELRLFGQDTTRAATLLVRDLPGPLGELFEER